MNSLLHELIFHSAERSPARIALTYAGQNLSYGQLADRVRSLASGLIELAVMRSERVAIYLEKRLETVIACFGASAAGAVFVPINPLLKPDQVEHILRDCNACVLVTSKERYALLKEILPHCSDLRRIVLVDTVDSTPPNPGPAVHPWAEVMSHMSDRAHRVIDVDMLAILYTSGSTGRPKGVVLSHRNMVTGAKSVAQYLENHPEDTLLSALPLSFDAGFSQLTTAFHAGARVVLLNYLLPRDVLNALDREHVSGFTAVPPLWIQLTHLKWPATIAEHLRYMANTGGRMPLETLKFLRNVAPRAKVFLMYGLTEAFRATYLSPDQVDIRPDSIGKAIPNAEVLVLREDGSECGPDEPGELVQRGALVGMGYWNDPAKTAERYRPMPGREAGLVVPEMAVFSGDTVRKDSEGFLYFIGRRDEMIKTSGYRVSPNEIEEVVYATDRVGECAALGVAHPALGQAIVVVAAPRPGSEIDVASLTGELRQRLPAYMVPMHIDIRAAPLPRNPNGKIDRNLLSIEMQRLFEGETA